MRGLEKFFLFIFSFVIMAVAVVFFAITAPLIFLANFQTSFQMVFNSWAYAFLAIVVFIFALSAVIFSLCSGKRLKSVSKQGELGEYRISFVAFENLVFQSTEKIKGIRETKTRLFYDEKGLSIYLRVVVLPDVKIPELVAEIQQTVQDYLEEISGVTIAEIKVLVDSISKESRLK